MTAEPIRPALVRSRAVATTFALAALLVGVAAWIGLGLQRDGLAVFWPAAGAIAGLAAAAPRGLRRLAVLGGAALAVGAMNLLFDRPPVPSLIFVAGGVAEGLLLVVGLEHTVGGMRFNELRPVVAFFAVCVGVSVAVGAAVAAGLVGSGFAGPFVDLWRAWFVSHLVGLLTVTPAVATMARGPGTWRVMLVSLWGRWVPVALLALTAYLLMAWMPLMGGFGTLLSVTVLYALLLLIAVRCEPAVTAFSLLVLGAVAVWHARFPGGAMGDDVYSAAAVLVAASMWALTIGALLAQQRRALRAVTESELRLRQSMHVGRAFAFEWDPVTDRVVRTDPSSIVGDVRVGSSATFLDGVDPRDRPLFQQALASLSRHRPSYSVRYRYLRDDGRTIWLEERAHASFDEAGRMTMLRGMTADVTERAQAETALKEADAAKDRFIATLSHELRNPLAPIRNAAEALRRLAGEGDAVARCHRVIDRQLRQMVYLLDELLDVGRISQGKLRLNPRRVTLDEVLDQACTHVAAQLEATGQRLEVRRPDVDVVLYVDPARLVQAIDNLLGNASKYSAHGARIALDASVEAGEAGEGAGTLVVAVRDEGIGLRSTDLERVFDVFTQLDAPDTASPGGLGIGLWLVRQIVTMQGGTVTVWSAGPGQGSTFTIRLPVEASPAAAPDPRSVGHPSRSTA